MNFFALLVLAVSFSLADKVRYDNYKVYELTPKDEEVLLILKRWERSYNSSEFQFWTPLSSADVPVDIMVSPSLVDDIEYLIKTRGLNSTLLIKNVQENIDKERVRPHSKGGGFDWINYHTFEEYVEYLKSLEKYCAGVTLLKAGTSYEGRDLLGVHVSFSPENKKNAIFIESQIHAREWISGAVSTFILNEILTSNDTAVRKVVERYDWYVFPIFNPDGFVFSHTDNRIWRKTRVPYGRHFGADPNRNWGYLWNTGASADVPHLETYVGPHPFSEPCVKYMSEFITSVADKLVAYISFHSFKQQILLPYGHTIDYLDNYDVTYPIGLAGAKSLAKRYGTIFDVGTTGEIHGWITGGAMDWVKATFGIPLVYTYELRDKGHHGFSLPEDQIIPSGLETLDSLLTMLEEYEKTK